MEQTKYSRILDSTGRLVIPAKLRAQLGIAAEQPYDFYIHEHEGATYLCIKAAGNDKIQEAIKLLEEAGMKITKD